MGMLKDLLRAMLTKRRPPDAEGAEGPVIDVTPPRFSPPRITLPGWKAFGSLIVAVLLGASFWTCWYTVRANEVGIVLRLGRYTGSVTTPGLNFKLPLGIDVVTKVPVETQLKEEFGFRTKDPGVRTTYHEGSFEDESLMLTGDLNAAQVEWIVQYRIADPYRYLFRVRDVTGTFRDLAEAVSREVVGDRTINEVLTIGRQEIADQVGLLLQKLCDQYETGITVDQVILQDVTPPEPVKASFNEVNQAQQEREKLINQARAEYNQVIPRAKGEAEQTIQQAEGYAVARVNRARGEAARFLALREEYRRAPAVTKQRLYLETMGEVLPRVQRKIVIDDKAKGILPLLNLQGGGEPAAGGRTP